MHETQDKTLPDQELKDISLNHQRQIINGPDTPKQDNLVTGKAEIKRKKDESEMNDLQERRQKRLEEQKKKERRRD